jgi:hypothetical protein
MLIMELQSAEKQLKEPDKWRLNICFIKVKIGMRDRVYSYSLSLPNAFPQV